MLRARRVMLRLVTRSWTVSRIRYRLHGIRLMGKPADLVIFDPGATWTVDPTEFHSRSRNTPYTGQVLTGRVERTIVGGRTVFQRDS